MGRISLLRSAPFNIAHHRTMIETNQITARIADLTARVQSLRGYL